MLASCQTASQQGKQRRKKLCDDGEGWLELVGRGSSTSAKCPSSKQRPAAKPNAIYVHMYMHTQLYVCACLYVYICVCRAEAVIEPVPRALVIVTHGYCPRLL